jgi:hypothetical protein
LHIAAGAVQLMSYVFELDPELTDVFVDNMGTSIVEFAIGYDVDEEEIVLFSVTLGPSMDGASDLRFGIRTRHATKEWKISGLDFTRERVSACIPSHGREQVRTLLLHAVLRLANSCLDERITMETYYPNLPAEAVEKYNIICNALEYQGFLIETKFRDDDGKDQWLFTKSEVFP